ncbi:tetratricopeptide repeat protein [Phenylobacterium soli]|uniref:Uncharacterized protein n=1 Tax=Phenylobacterium soli TaxID=2170551 RepID=A0A328AJI4_9CAUL|nr:tetratricopeptide repeat-containing glycosyltransferase family protein [Phenylobacterium soli]RAK53028.1 hypothetical protein DJ017_00010 [Phenylobacterium soli]
MRLTQDNILGEFMRAGELQQAGRWSEAAELWRAIAAAAPQSPEAHANLGAALLELGAFANSEAELTKAAGLAPEASWAHYHLARLFHLTHRPQPAEAEYRRALAVAPDDAKVRLGLGQLLLGLGRYPEGWPLYEARKDIPSQNAPRLDLPNEWRGETVAGKRLLIWPEQGFGDQIQFARFAPVLQAMGAEVTLVAPPELAAVFASLGVTVVEQAERLRLETPDHWTLPLSIPGRLGVTLETVPATPYLSAPADRRAKWAGYAPQGAVGVVWRGRPTHGNDAHRSLPSLAAFEPLADAGATLLDLTEPRGDFADTAAILDQLDLVVTVDTAIAHLAGAMGKLCWVLLPWFRTDWRWLEDRADSPWYPSLRLFRQPGPGAWDPVLQEVASAYRTKFGS